MSSSSSDPDNERRPGFFQRLFKGKVAPKENNGGDKRLDAQFSEHTWDLNELSKQFPDSNINVVSAEKTKGLTQAKADELLRVNGPNILPKPKEMSDFELFVRQFLNILWILLIVAALLTLVSYFTMDDIISLWVTILLFVLIFVMCTVSWYQEREARKVIRGFENLLPEVCNVIRDGFEKQIPAANVVVGDIIRIQSGVRVPADARIIDCAQLKLETSSITGEAEPLDYHTNSVTPNIPIFESHNVAFNSSLCVDGEGIGVVIRTGTNTVIGQIAALTTGQPPKKSRLEQQIKFFVHFLLVAAPLVGTISMIVGGLTFGWSDWILLLSTSYAVCAIAMVPEGLSATVTSILTVVARKLERKSVYLKRLDIAEALGSARIIASDKTGTLTKNVMTVTDMWVNDVAIHGFPRLDDKTLHSLKSFESFKPPISDIMLAMAVCNKADFEYDKDVKITIHKGDRDNMMAPVNVAQARAFAMASRSESVTGTIHRTLNKTILPFSNFGDFQNFRKLVAKKPALGAASDVAMLKYAAQVIDVGKTRRTNDVVFEIPFNSKRKWQLIIIKKASLLNNQAKYKLIMKGASDILLKKCSKIMNISEEEVSLDTNELEKTERAIQNFGEQGRRVIGFAQTEFVESERFEFCEKTMNFPQDELMFLGVCAIMDPPRDETADAIKSCKEAGIKIFMVTGDHHTTAKAIAEQIGLVDSNSDNPQWSRPNWEIVKGEDIAKLTHKDWDRLVSRDSLVFSRTTPEQKLLIVEECQKRKHVIAMTGDGVNDSPALKKADIGVGMGSGSEVAKQAADIILMNDNFASIVASIKEGRLMFENIKKLMVYVLPHAITELWGIWIYYLFGMPVAINSLIVLSIDLGTEIPPGIAMCNEPFESDIMRRPPRRHGKNIISKALLFYTYGYMGLIQAIGCFLAYWYIFWSHDIPITDLPMSALDYWKIDGKNFTTSNGHIFTVEKQMEINRQAISAWQIGIVFGQMFHLFSARSLRESMFHHGFFTNKSAIIAVIIEFIMLMIFVYVPGVNTFLGGAPVPIMCWVLVGAVGVFIFIFNEIRKFCIRHWPRNPVVRIFKF